VRRYSASDVARIFCKAIEQGVSRSDISLELATRCHWADDGCSCEDLLKELAQAQHVTALALEIGLAVTPAIKAAKKAREILEKLRARGKTEETELLDQVILRTEEQRALEKILENSERSMSKELDRIIERTNEVSQMSLLDDIIEGAVKIKADK